MAALYGANIAPQDLQVSVTRKEFEGDYTLVVFPLLRISHASPEATGEAIGAYLKENVPEIAGYNCVKGFLNLLLSPVYWDETLKESSGRVFGMDLIVRTFCVTSSPTSPLPRVAARTSLRDS